jgi:hypothetical protein
MPLLPLDAVLANMPSPLSLFPETPVPPLLLAPKTPLALGTIERPNTPLPPGTLGGARVVASFRAKMPLLALDVVKASPPSSEGLVLN